MKTKTISNWKELGQRIAEARKARGMSQTKLGEPLGLDRSAISRIESGDRCVDTLELAHIAEALARPIDWFVLGLPQAVVSRRDAQAGASVLQGDELLERLAQDVDLLVAMKLLRPDEGSRKGFRLKSLSDAEKLAVWARQQLDCFGPLDDLSRALQRFELYSFSQSAGRESLVGAYVNLGYSGVALVNGDMPSGRRRFALVHELGHHLLQDDSDTISDVASSRGERERLIDAFAIHFLLPRRSIGPRWKGLFDDFGDARRAAILLGHEYGVSWSALVAHLRTLGLIDVSTRVRLDGTVPTKSEFMECGIRLTEDLLPPALPPMYSAAVVRAYRKHKISAERAVEMMHGALELTDLPAPDAVPMDSYAGDLEPLE